MSFGDQTVIFVTITDGPKDRLGIPSKVRTEVPVAGCMFRPLSAAETVTLTDITTELWQLTVEPGAVVLNANAIGEVKYLGNTYQIVVGPRPYTDFSSAPFVVTMICKRQVA